MSMDYYVMCDRPLASVEEWQRAIDDLGFDLKISPTCDVATMKGVLPAIWQGQATDFECSPFPFASLQETYDDTDFGGKWPFAYVMYAGSLGGCLGALIAAAAIVTRTGGQVFDPQEEFVMPPDEAVRYAARVEADIVRLQSLEQ